MATKLRKSQAKRKYEGRGLEVPSELREEVASLAGGAFPASPQLRHFSSLLLALLTAGGTYAEIEALKPFCKCAAEWLAGDARQQAAGDGSGKADGAGQQQENGQQREEQRRAQGLLARLLLLPNSRPLHKQLLSGLRAVLEGQERRVAADEMAWEDTLAGMAAALISRHAQQELAASAASGSAGGSSSKHGALLLGPALAALSASPACRPALLGCVVPAISALAASISSTLAQAGQGGRSWAAAGTAGGEGSAAAAQPGEGQQEAASAAEGAAYITTDLMDLLQDSVSALYALLSQSGQQLLQRQPEQAAAAVAAAGEALLLALQGEALVREALASAAVALYAAAALPEVQPAAMARCLAAGLMLPAEQGGEEVVSSSGSSLGLLDARLKQRGSSLVAELQKMPALNRVCAIRGLFSALPFEVLCAPLECISGSDSIPAAYGQGEAAGVQADKGPWTLLIDGAVPAIAAALQGTTDEHFRFHAFATLSVCLERLRHFQQHAIQQAAQQAAQQEAEQEAASPTALAAPVLGALRQRLLLGMLWQGFEAALGQTVHRLHASFECLLDILQQQEQLPGARHTTLEGQGQGQGQQASLDEADSQGVLLSIAGDLVSIDASRKGRYAPLTAIIPRAGARRLLGLQPDLVSTCLAAMRQHAMSSAVGGTLLALVAQLRREAEAEAAAAGLTEPAGTWRDAWLPPLAAALSGGGEVHRDNLATHLLPQLLSADPPSLGLLLQRLLPGSPAAGATGDSHEDEGAAAACLAVLKAARKQLLLAELDALSVPGLDGAAVRSALLAAVRSGREGLRVDALSLACNNPRMTALPTPLELEVASEAVRLTLRCSNSSLKHKLTGPLNRLLMRMRASVAAALARDRAGSKPVDPAVAAQARWLHWLARTLVDSLYPGGSHERAFLALELLQIQLEAFGDLINPSQAPPAWTSNFAALPAGRFDAWGPGFLSEGTVQLLLAAALDSWERLREAAAATLLRLPTPLPGLGTPAALRPLLACALRLLGCPRGREADSGAQLLLLILRKYGGAGGQLHWQLDVMRGTVEAPPAEPAAAADAQLAEAASARQQVNSHAQRGVPEEQAAALWRFLSSACELLESRIGLAEGDMLEACRGGLAQGPLLALRYSIPHIPWKALAEQASAQAHSPGQPGGQAGARRDWRGLVSRLLDLTYAAADLTLPFLSKPQDQNMDAADVDADDVVLDELAGDGAELAADGGGDALGPRAQIIMTACWQSGKECGLLLGGLARALPVEGPAALLSPDQLSRMASYFTRSLCALKHNGAVDKTQQGFTALCERLLQCSDPALRGLPQRCLTQLLAFAARPGQGRSDIVRRSAGLPFGVVAIFYAEPVSSQKVLLRRGMGELLAAAGNAELESWPRVHALNCMRAAFQDANLAADTSAYLAPGLQTAILGMAAPQWEVRNAASLAYTALLVRVMGFRNQAGKGTVAAKRAPTAPDFFARHPQLHPFLQQQFTAAVDCLQGTGSGSSSQGEGSPGEGGTGGGSSGSTDLHPSLFPILVLLSRLRPSRHSRLSGGSGSSALAEQQLSPAPFAHLLQRCAAASAAAVRQLAADALPPLLPPEQQAAAAAALAAAVRDGLAAAAAAASGQEGAPVQRPSFNVVHGQLLQLRSLLEAAAGEGAEPAAAASLLAAVAPPLAGCADVACCLDTRASAVPAAVSLAYIRVAAAAAALLPAARQLPTDGSQPEAAAGEAERWLAAVQGACWRAVERSASTAPPADFSSPMLSCAYKHATQLCFALLLRPPAGSASTCSSSSSSSGGGSGLPADQLLSRLSTALGSRQYEVRCAALKVLLQHLCRQAEQHHQQQQGSEQQGSEQQSVAAAVAADARLRKLLLQQLASEGHHKARRRLLHLLSLLPPAEESSEAGQASAAAEFATVLQHASAAADSRAKQHAVCCLGPLLSQQLNAASSSEPAASAGWETAARQLLALAADCSQPWQLPELRLAAAQALASSGLLQLDPAASQAAAQAAADAWAMLLVVLEDEDEEVREVACRAAAAALADLDSSTSCSSSAGRPAAADGGSASAAAEPAVPSEDRVLRRLFPALARRFGPHPALLGLLGRLCCPAAAPALAAILGGSAVAAGRAAGSPAEQESKIFDREPDNMHEEPVLLAQLAAGALAGLLPHVIDPSTAAAVQAWAGSALDQLTRLSAQLQETAGGAAGEPVGPMAAGGLPQHRHFAELHCAWLALWAASRLPEAGWTGREAAAASVAALGAGPAGAGAEGSTPQLAEAARAAVAAWAGQAAEDTPSPLFLV